ncbi:uncharacterized protein PFLUO_LOCUS7206 [Penicillium psychrofluorescens]|uniref:uncharacterized protein n=1 Tax=Penicillium psychrofluorescens TaxID=3158075 RepID=UPI003CCD12E6
MPSMKSTRSRAGGADRGGIRKRGPTRTDRDGDMEMDGPGRGKRTRGDTGRATGGGRAQTRDKTVDAIQQAISSSTKESQANIRQSKGAARASLEQFRVSGWKQSKAASNRDGGVESLVAFLERRLNAITKSGPRAKITKSRVEGDSLVVSVRPELAERMLRINGNQFAGIQIAIEPQTANGSLDQELAATTGTSAATADTKSKMTAILAKRYYPDTKLLDLSKLGTDPDLQAMGIFNSTSTESKFFPALMKVWEMGFTSSAQRREAVQSVSLGDNQLANISVVTTLSQTIPDLKNLDLSNNNFKDMHSLIGWRWKFRSLEFLDLNGNPFSADPGFKDTMLKWYPKLRFLNHVEVRTAEDIAAQKKTPIPVQAPYFQDESQIGENFVRAFFVGYDNDRNDLLNGVYDSGSTFSLNVNTQAPKAQHTETAGWDSYIKKSRNLLKISHLPARMSRTYVGADSIRELWNTLPPTRHPDMTAHPEEWLIECHPIPGLPDPSGQSESGVGGLLVMVHGKYEESVANKVEIRSFDRTFILGPGGGVGGIRVISDILCLRAYGGHEAWSPENQAIPQAAAPAAAPAAAQPPVPVAQPGVPDGYGAPGPGKTDVQVRQEQLIAQLSARSRMTLQFSEMALSSNNWNLETAWQNFEHLRAQGGVPADAFLPA